MPVNYDTQTKTGRMTVVRDNIDSGPGPGTIEICTAGYATVLAVVTLNDPCGSISGDVLTFLGFPKTVAASASGTAAAARIKDSTGTVRANGLTVGTSGSDINLSSTTITGGGTPDNVQITSASITHAA